MLLDADFKIKLRHYIAVKGNHDADGWDDVQWLWSGSQGYQAMLVWTRE